jgi:hypothetical protein
MSIRKPLSARPNGEIFSLNTYNWFRNWFCFEDIIRLLLILSPQKDRQRVTNFFATLNIGLGMLYVSDPSSFRHWWCQSVHSWTGLRSRQATHDFEDLFGECPLVCGDKGAGLCFMLSSTCLVASNRHNEPDYRMETPERLSSVMFCASRRNQWIISRLRTGEQDVSNSAKSFISASNFYRFWNQTKIFNRELSVLQHVRDTRPEAF